MITIPMKRVVISLFSFFALTPAFANSFSAVASPPRFELRANAGQTVQEVIELTNANSQESTFTVRTLDWTLRQDTTVDFKEELSSNSCRTWVSLERPAIKMRAGGKFRYRFQVKVPENATPGQCRFAIVIEGDTFQPKDQPLPVSARLAVIVYLTVGDAKPALVLKKTDSMLVNSVKHPAIWIENTGNAHDRLSGFVKAVDAKGVSFELSPSTFPILPGETRHLFLQPDSNVDLWPKAAYPLRLTGSLEWGHGKISLDQVLVR
jgi:hypothetical protein